MTIPSALTPLLAFVNSPSNSMVEYVVGGTTIDVQAREGAAQIIADDAMTIAMGASALLQDWRDRRDGGPARTGSRLAALKTFVGLAFGVPGAPSHDNHVQGHVAELLWNRIIQERTTCRDGRQLVQAHPVKPDPKEPGGDGLVVYEDRSGTLVFRLWEMKKFAPNKPGQALSGTINRASHQLSERGHVYLAKLAAPTTTTHTGPLRQLYELMVERWFDRDPCAGAGVSVGTCHCHTPTDAATFHSLSSAFPDFKTAGQLEGIVVAVPDFPDFVKRVREIVWSGL